MASGLAPATAQAEYFGTFNLYAVTQNVFGPAVVVGVLTRCGVLGWVIIAVVTLAAAMLMPLTVAAASPQPGIAPQDAPGTVQAEA